MEKRNEIKKVIIGRKPISAYIPAVVFELSKTDEIQLSATGSNINKQERIIRLLADLSKKPIKEFNREVEQYGDTEAIVCTLKKKR